VKLIDLQLNFIGQNTEKVYNYLMLQKRIVVLRGGPSSEHHVSLKTGKSIIEVLKDKHHITDVVIDKAGKWYINGFEKSPVEATKLADVVFNALHGEYGEDGKVQQILEHLGIPFTGSKALSSALAMNKGQAKEIFRQNSLKTPIYRIIKKGDRSIDEIAFDLYKNFVMPVIIKPVNRGSSIGVSVARDMQSLRDTLTSLFLQYDTLLVEEYIKGKEGTISIIDDFRSEQCYACLPSEVCIPDEHDIFNHDYKYSDERKDLNPGNFSKEEVAQMTELAQEAHNLLGLRHYSRADFIVHPRRGVYLLEVNSLPDISHNSVFVKSLASVGATYEGFLDHVISLALKR